MSELKTQGTELYVLDSTISPPAVLKIAKLTNIDGLGGSASDIDITNFDSTAKEYLVGLQDNGTANFGLNLDPQDSSHVWLKTNAGGNRFQWAIGCSEDAGVPPTSPGGSVFVLGTSRTWFTFEASVQQAQIAFATDDAVRVQGSLRVSGSITMVPATT